MDGVEGDLFRITTGLRQGCVMSPTLFNMYMDAMMAKVTECSVGAVLVGNGQFGPARGFMVSYGGNGDEDGTSYAEV